MVRIHRTTTAALMACVLATCSPNLVLASEEDQGAPHAIAPRLTYEGKPLAAFQPATLDQGLAVDAVALAPSESSAFGQWGGGFRRGRGRNNAAAAAIFLGAAGAIAGTALLVYADRPDCNVNPTLGGCGYGTKVAAGAVLSAGLVGLLVGAVMWR